MAYDIGPRIGIEGEAEFKRAIKDININLKTIGTELKAVTSAYDRNDKSAQKLTAQNKVLEKQIDAHRNKLVGLNAQLEKVAKSEGENSAAAQKLKQDINNTTAALNRSELQLKNNKTSLDNHEKALKDNAMAAVKAAKDSDEFKKAQERLNGALNTVKIAALAVAGAIAYAGKAAIDYESAFAGVRKTVNATEEELMAMSDGIRSMAQEIPVAANDLAGIAENAGQLGIQTENILSFTRTMADLGVATNLTGEEAAQTLAKFANITQMPQSEFSNLGATIVDLGNNLATTEADIAAMALRLAGAGKQVGMTEAQILSFSGALSSVGIEAEMGGSAFSKVMLEMQMAAQTGEQAMTGFAQVAGVSARDFKTLFEKDAAGAIISFIEGLGKLDNAALVLDKLGMNEVRLRDALLRASGASNVFKDAITLGTKAWEDNVALTNEANQRYETTASQLQILKNVIQDAAIEVGNELLPQIQNLTAYLKDADFTPVVNALKWIIDNGRLIASTAVAIGAGMALWNVTQTVYAVVQAIQVWKGAMDVAKAAQLGLNAVMAASPWGIAITLIGAVAAGLGVYALTAGKAKSAAQELAEETANLSKEYEKNKAEVEKSEAADLAKMRTAQDLTDELYDLEKQVESGTLTEDEAIKTKEQMYQIADQLRQLMPDVAIEFDNETGSIITQKAEVEKLIDSYIRLAKAKAGQVRLEKAYATLFDAQVAERQAKEGKKQVEAEIDAYGNNLNRPTNIYDPNQHGYAGAPVYAGDPTSIKIAADMRAYTKAEEEAIKAQKEVQKDIDTVTELMREQGITIGETTKKTTDLDKATKDLSTTSAGASKTAVSGAKSTAKANKETSDELAKQRDKDFKDLKFYLDMGYITENQYYTRLEWLRDDYFEEGSDDWQKHTLDIYNFHKKSFEEIEKKVKDTYAEIAKSATAEIDKVKSAQDGLQNKLNNYAKLFKTVRITGGETTEEYVRLGDMKKANEELQNYADLLSAVKDRGAGDELFSLLRDMDISEATKNAKVLMNATDEEFNNFISDLKSNRELNKAISEELYTDDMTNALASGVQSALDGLSEMTDEYASLGAEYANAIGAGFKEAMAAIKFNMGDEFNNIIRGLNIAAGGGGITVGTGGGSKVTSTTFNSTVNLNGTNATPAQANRAQELFFRTSKFRGFAT